MSQQYEEYDETDEGGERGPQTPQEFAALRVANREKRAAEAAAAAARREAAFLRAGIDPESKGLAAYFVKGYDGDLDPVKIREAAIEAGVLAPPAPDPAQVQRQAENAAALGAQQQVQQAAVHGDATPTVESQQVNGMREALNAGGVDALGQFLQAQGIPSVEF